MRRETKKARRAARRAERKAAKMAWKDAKRRSSSLGLPGRRHGNELVFDLGQQFDDGALAGGTKMREWDTETIEGFHWPDFFRHLVDFVRGLDDAELHSATLSGSEFDNFARITTSNFVAAGYQEPRLLNGFAWL